MANIKKRILSGVVTRDTKDKSGVLLVVRIFDHPKYSRTVKRSNKFHFHDPDNVCKAGDKAFIIESRRYSKMKSWRLLRVQNEA